MSLHLSVPIYNGYQYSPIRSLCVCQEICTQTELFLAYCLCPCDSVCVCSQGCSVLFQRSLVSSHPLSLTSCLPWFTHNNISSFSHIPPAEEISSLMLFTETHKRRFPSSSLFVIILVTKRMKNWKKMRILPTVPVSDGKSQRGGRFGLVCFLFPACFVRTEEKQVMSLHN